ncbi:hypothetical protein KFE98_19890 [bacterium SCSIO 12741]|nr:hypothetical protein KFE98_19890 [bacterium SCSIO 12741]
MHTGKDRQQKLREQNLPLALVAGALSAISMGLGWFFLSFYAGSHLSFIAIPVSLLLAFFVHLAGKGVSPLFGWVGVLCQLACCLFAIHLRAIDRFAEQNKISFLEAFSFFPADPLLDWMMPVIHPLDLVFCSLSVLIAYRYSFKEEKR